MESPDEGRALLESILQRQGEILRRLDSLENRVIAMDDHFQRLMRTETYYVDKIKETRQPNFGRQPVAQHQLLVVDAADADADASETEIKWCHIY